MAKEFRIGDHVTWNSEAGHVRGRVIKGHTGNAAYRGYTHQASENAPQQEMKSDRTNHIAIHKGTAMQELSG